MKDQINERGCYTQGAKGREDGNMRINDPYQSHYPGIAPAKIVTIMSLAPCL